MPFRDLSAMYVITKQAADICDSSHHIRYTSTKWMGYHMHVFVIVWQFSQIWKMWLQTDTLSCKQYYLAPTLHAGIVKMHITVSVLVVSRVQSQPVSDLFLDRHQFVCGIFREICFSSQEFAGTRSSLDTQRFHHRTRPLSTCWHIVAESSPWTCGPGDWSSLLHAATLTVTRNSADWASLKRLRRRHNV